MGSAVVILAGEDLRASSKRSIPCGSLTSSERMDKEILYHVLSYVE